MAYGISAFSKRGLRTAVLALALLPVLAGTALAGAEVGTPAPDWTLDDLDDNTWTMSGLAGKVVFLAMVGFS
jgi:hypothetical protein